MGAGSRKKGLLCAAGSGALWGMTGPLGQYLFSDKGVVPEWLVPYRLIAAGTLLLLWMFFAERKEVVRITKDKKDVLHLIVYGICGMMTVQYSFFVAVQESNGGTATVLQYLNPAMMIVFLAVVKKQLPQKKEVVAVLVAMIGVFLLATNGNIHTLVVTPRGIFFGLVCAMFSCLYSLLPKRLLERYDARVVCGYAMLIGGIVLTLWKRPWTLGYRADAEVWLLFVFLITVGTAMPFMLSMKALATVGPIYTNLLASVEPVVASLVTWLVLKTQFGKMELVGFACIIATIVMLSVEKPEQPPASGS